MLIATVLGTGALGLSSTLPFPGLTLPAHATGVGRSDLHYIFVYFQGGWDALLGLDPRDPSVYTQDNIAYYKTYPGYENVEMVNANRVQAGGIQFGPYIGNLTNHVADLQVFRGLSMDTLTHEVGRRRFITGRPPAGTQARGSSLATVLAAQFGQDDVVPNLVGRVETFNPDQPSWASAMSVNSVDDLVAALSPNPSDIGEIEREQIDALLERFRETSTSQRSKARSSALEFRKAAHEVVQQNLGSVFDFGANTEEMAIIRDAYGFNRNQLATPSARTAMALRALTQGVSRCVSVSVTDNLDTHANDWESDHGPRLRDGFDRVAQLVQDLKTTEYRGTQDSWFDHTVIVGFSEFQRTAMVNARGGRDHSLSNTAFVMGGGLRGGRVLGASGEVGMIPQNIDLATGMPSPGGEVIRPEHIHRALLKHAGIDDDIAELRVPAYDAMLS
ncbi:MAG: hypothetical protein ACJAV2_004838 [Myxococcota bacterium]|jgi:hypothetical protein